MTERKQRTANNGLVQCGVKCFVSAFVVKPAFVLRINSSANKPALHQAAARWAQAADFKNDDKFQFTVDMNEQFQ